MTEILPTLGSKEAIGHFPLAVLDPGDVALIPEPGYPPYRSGTIFAGAEPYLMPLRAENDFLPDLDAIPADVLKRAKLIFVNYPNDAWYVPLDSGVVFTLAKTSAHFVWPVRGGQ